MKGQIEAVALPLLLTFLFLFALMTAYLVSEENISMEVDAQTESSLVEFKALTAMNSLLVLEQASPKAYFDPADEYDGEAIEITANRIFDANTGRGRHVDHFMDLEDADIEVGDRNGKLVKSIYIPSPEGPRELRVGAER